jgi:hypothetical protein
MENVGPNAWRRRAAGFATALIVAALGAVALSASASAAYPGENGRIAYSIDGDIRTVAADGSDDTVLADESPTPPDAATSPPKLSSLHPRQSPSAEESSITRPRATQAAP